ncbi:MAG: hypothetical protein IKX22_04690 [Prevotella sp.]|nr:hypothetical protein [Prevotella sp.]
MPLKGVDDVPIGSHPCEEFSSSMYSVKSMSAINLKYTPLRFTKLRN